MINYHDKSLCDRICTGDTPSPADSSENCAFVCTGILNILFPGLGMMVLGCYVHDCTDTSIGILQLFAALIPIVGWLWSLVWGVILIAKTFSYGPSPGYRGAPMNMPPGQAPGYMPHGQPPGYMPHGQSPGYMPHGQSPGYMPHGQSPGYMPPPQVPGMIPPGQPSEMNSPGGYSGAGVVIDTAYHKE